MTSPESMTFTQLATTDPKWKPVSGGAFNQRQAHSGWNKVTIVSGGQYEKEYVLSSVLRALEPSQFIPFAYGVHGTDSYFHIYCVSAVGAIIDRGYKITTLEGIAWIVKLEPCGPPRYTYYFLKDVLSKVVQLRFNQEKKLLDLSHFAMDEAFTDIAYPSLTIQKVVQDVFYKFLTLVALDLSDNKLHTLDHFGSFTKKIVSVKYLNLKNNLLKDMNSLDILQGLTLLQELILDGNPLCSKYSDGNAYIKEVRQRFPRIKSLDGISLPPVEANGIPPSKSHFLLSNKGKKIVEQFLEGYYNRYDSDDRKNLLDTYHDEAMFSLTSTYLAGQDLASSSVKLTPYMLESRNILRTSDYSKCHKLLRQGKSEIVSFLATLPKTEHDASSFSVDLIHFTPKVMVLSTCGVFRERDSNDEKKDGPLRSFSRLFAVVPFRKKFCIVNEELHVTNASKQQIQMSFPPLDMTDEESLESIDSEDKMVAVLSEITTMKPEWAKKCLVETNWNLKDALVTFRDLYKQSSVPVEAFK